MFPYFQTNFIAALSIFLVMAVAVGFLATAMTKSAVCMKNKTHLSDGVIGGLLLGIITSIPELISGVMGVMAYAQKTDVTGPSGVLGDAIGSDMFCIFALAISLLVCVKLFHKKQSFQINTFTVAFIVVGAIFCLLAGLFENNGIIYGNGETSLINGPSPLVWNGFNLFSIFILLSYVASIVFMVAGAKIKIDTSVSSKLNHTPINQKGLWFSKMPIGTLVLIFVLFSAGLTVCSLVLADTSDALIQTHWAMQDSFGRSMLLGVATSLPELITIISLARSKEYNLSINTTAGSCGFNLTILFICNIAYSIVLKTSPINDQHAMYCFDDFYNALQLVLFLFELIFLIIYLVLNSKAVKQYLTKKQVIGVNSVFLSLIVIAYIAFVVIGFLVIRKTRIPPNPIFPFI